MIQFFKDRFFQKELKRQIKTLIVVGVGFSIAFTWRQTTFDTALKIVKTIFPVEGQVTSSVIASLFITIVGIVLILLSSKFLKNGY